MPELFENERLDSIKVIHLIYRKWKLLLVIAGLGFAASVGITTLIPPTYYSYGVIYPTYGNSADEILNNPQFGHDVHADRLMQILDSETIRDSMISQYNLIEYYELDSSKIGWEHTLLQRYSRDITFFRSRYLSVVITATTRDPKLSANLVNSIIDMVDKVREGIFRENMVTGFQVAEDNYLQKRELVQTLVDSIFRLRQANASASLNLQYEQYRKKLDEVSSEREKLMNLQSEYGVVDLEPRVGKVQAEAEDLSGTISELKAKLQVLESQYGNSDSLVVMKQAELAGYEARLVTLQNRAKELQGITKSYQQLSAGLSSENAHLQRLRQEYEDASNDFDPLVQSMNLTHLNAQLDLEMEQLDKVQVRYEDALRKYTAPFPKVYTINRARAADRKAGPSYSFNAMMGTIGSLLFVLIFLILRERFRMVKREIERREA